MNDSRIQSTSTAIGLTYGSYIIGNIVLIIAALTLGAIGLNLTAQPSLHVLLSTVLLQGVTYGGIAIIYLKVRNLDFEFVPFSIPSKRDLVITVIGTVGILGLLFAMSSAISYLGLESAQNKVVEIGQQSPATFLLLILLSFLLVGPGEELLFRGLVQGVLRESFTPVRAIVLASALFASLHLFSLTGNGKLVYIGITFVLALVLGATYEYTENIIVPSLIHGAYNAIQFAFAYLAAT
ncbi:type II CAAX endopeptidase family protein [Natrinema sp. 1APR25-10V2]|uniref:CPBP family intramembrane glutamic endopeptidase n=1 Tax=Natrinema sp. 1APR25-10V2 TaxID=2951081 RepID=UPI00287547AC|nr:type II CAAX endopeptidase family protein [Natrinema sp. 1APR25-10V2]MDS0478388.1 CPBP family intramembrane metalloprotease [Natrinema sp. 1APR25-10V2]